MTDPEILNRTLVSSGDTAVDSVVLENPKSEPVPTYASVCFSTDLPKNLNSPVESGDTDLDSVVLENPKSDPEPT